MMYYKLQNCDYNDIYPLIKGHYSVIAGKRVQGYCKIQVIKSKATYVFTSCVYMYS